MNQVIPYVITLPTGRVVEVSADTEENALAAAALCIGVEGLPAGTTAEPEVAIQAERLLSEVRAADSRVANAAETAKAQGFVQCAAQLREANQLLIAACCELHEHRPGNDLDRLVRGIAVNA